MVAPNQRQRIDVEGLPAEAIQDNADAVSALLTVFDAALAAQRRIAVEVDMFRSLANTTLGRFVDVRGGVRAGVVIEHNQDHAEYALRLWCSANNIDLEVDDYIYSAARWHVLRARLDGVEFVSVQKSWPLETEPRLATDADRAWRPEPEVA